MHPSPQGRHQTEDWRRSTECPHHTGHRCLPQPDRESSSGQGEPLPSDEMSLKSGAVSSHQTRDLEPALRLPDSRRGGAGPCHSIKPGLPGHRFAVGEAPPTPSPRLDGDSRSERPQPPGLTSTSCPATPARQTPSAAPPRAQRGPRPGRRPAIFGRRGSAGRRSGSRAMPAGPPAR